MGEGNVLPQSSGVSRAQASLVPRPFFAGEEKRPGTICSRMRMDPQNLGILDMPVYFPLVSTVVLRNMSVFVS